MSKPCSGRRASGSASKTPPTGSPAGRRGHGARAGGASMFAALMTPGTLQMGERNIVAARNALRVASIPIQREAVGGDQGRSVRFHLADGRVEIRAVGRDVEVI